MMEHRVLAGLQPERVYRFFEELCQLPHESHKTAAASDWAERFAKERGLKHRRDEAGNVIIWKNASAGYEDHSPVILQGHLDMVCVKENGVEHDFDTEPLDLYIEDGYIKARGTSLGGDDGVAVAFALAVLDDDTLVHPPIEVVLTTDEEVGLLGAVALDCSDLKGHTLINIDSEAEGLLTVSCAGGARCDISREYPTEDAAGAVCTLTVDGLMGGHSGVEIHKGLANANKILAAALQKLAQSSELRLVSIVGGLQDNAIPKEATAKFVLPEADAEAAAATVAETAAAFQSEFAAVDPGLQLTLQVQPGSAAALSQADSASFIQLLCDYPNGVLAMSQDIEGLVQTSLNLGILRLENGACQLSSSIRSSIGAEKAALSDRLETLAKQYSATFGQRGGYPAWEYRKDSPLRDTMVRIYKEQYGQEPAVAAIHAGLECGILASKIADLDAVSIGPDICDVHSTRERLGIESTQRVWNYLVAVLAAL